MLVYLGIEPGMRIVELGCGTGESLLYLDREVGTLERIDLVDSCPVRLAVARRRAIGQANVLVHEADPASWQPAVPADRVLMHGALTMQPAWQEVIANARRMLAPGGLLGVVDIHLPWHVPDPLKWLWRSRHAREGLHLSDEHLDELKGNFSEHWYSERCAGQSLASWLRAPHYLFVGRR